MEDSERAGSSAELLRRHFVAGRTTLKGLGDLFGADVPPEDRKVVEIAALSGLIPVEWLADRTFVLSLARSAFALYLTLEEPHDPVAVAAAFYGAGGNPETLGAKVRDAAIEQAPEGQRPQ